MLLFAFEWSVIAVVSTFGGIVFGLLGFFFSDPNDRFPDVRWQITKVSAVGGAVFGVLILLFFGEKHPLKASEFCAALAIGVTVCSIATWLTICFGRKCYFLLNTVSADERLRPPRH